jgi:hypothetical protein
MGSLRTYSVPETRKMVIGVFCTGTSGGAWEAVGHDFPTIVRYVVPCINTCLFIKPRMKRFQNGTIADRIAPYHQKSSTESKVYTVLRVPPQLSSPCFPLPCASCHKVQLCSRGCFDTICLASVSSLDALLVFSLLSISAMEALWIASFFAVQLQYIADTISVQASGIPRRRRI